MLIRLTHVVCETIKGGGGAQRTASDAETWPVCAGWEASRGPAARVAGVEGREREKESDGHSLVLRARTDGNTACGHSHLAVKVPKTKAEPDSSQSEISDAGLTFGHMKLTHVYQWRWWQ